MCKQKYKSYTTVKVKVYCDTRRESSLYLYTEGNILRVTSIQWRPAPILLMQMDSSGSDTPS